MIMYDSGADGHYISKKTEKRRAYLYYFLSTKQVMIANGDKSKGQHVTSLPFPSLSATARQADTFNEFPTSLMSVGKTADNSTMSIFTKDGVTVHNKKKTY